MSESGAQVPIVGAGKLAGRAGDFELGMTAAYLDEAFGVDTKPAFAGRLIRPVFGDSTVGLIATAGDPESNGDNGLLGADFRYQTSEWLDDETLVANLFCLGSQTDPVIDPDYTGHAYRMGLSWPGDTITVDLQAAEISAGFDPALGFIKRNDIRYVGSTSRYLIRPDNPTWFQWFSLIYANQTYTNLDNEIQTRSNSFYPRADRLSGNGEISLGITDTYDRPEYAFTLPGGEISSNLMSLYVVLRFTPEVRWSNLLQYDTISDSLGFNPRFSWEYQSGQQVDVVLTQSYWDSPTDIQLTDSELIAKLGMQFRF